MVRKIRALLFLVVLCLLLSAVTNAAERTHIVEELGMSIKLPSNMVVFTRDIDENDPNLAAYGLTKNAMQQLMTDGNIYLNAWVEDASYEIIVTMIDSPLMDYNLYSNTILETLGTSLESEYRNAGIILESFELYQHGQAKFFVLNISQPNGNSTAYGLQYHTVYADKVINITLQSYEGEVDQDKKAILKDIVDGIEFNTDPQKKNETAPTDAFVYVDTLSGMEFTVPENWVKENLSKDREFLSAKFISNEEEGLCILFGSEDMWSSLSENDKKGLSRKDLNNTLLTKSDYAEMCGCSASDVEMVSFAGKEYFCAEASSTEDVYGLTITATMTQYLRCENGYMYIFQFGGTRDSEHYGDFELLMDSVVYPEITQEKHTPTQNIPRTGKAELDDTHNTLGIDHVELEASSKTMPSTGVVLISLLLTIGVYSVPIIVYRYAIRKTPVEKKKAKRITIIYGLIAFVAMSAILYFVFNNAVGGSAIFLWSWVNYKVLSGGKTRLKNTKGVATKGTGKKEEIHSLEIKENNSISYAPEIVFCHKCGNKLIMGTLYCSKCGAKVYDGGNK